MQFLVTCMKVVFKNRIWLLPVIISYINSLTSEVLKFCVLFPAPPLRFSEVWILERAAHVSFSFRVTINNFFFIRYSLIQEQLKVRLFINIYIGEISCYTW